jgi:hypothetical protein
MNIRKLNRRSGPARVTQRGTTKTYPHPDYGKLARKQNRYWLEDPRAAGGMADAPASNPGVERREGPNPSSPT